MESLFQLIQSSGWRSGIGAPLWLELLVVGAYFSIALLCLSYLLRLRTVRAQSPALPHLFTLQCFYSSLSLIFILLGASHYLGAFNWLTSLGRKMALVGGWYGFRRSF